MSHFASIHERSGADEVFGVLLLYGRDQSDVLSRAIDRLEEYALNVDGQADYNVTQVWVRSFGEIGLVMLRFTTSEHGMRHLWRNCPGVNQRTMDDELIMTVHRADRPWTMDNSIPMQMYATAHEDAGWDATHHAHLATVSNVLAADALIDIAQHDFLFSKESPDGSRLPQGKRWAVHVLRVFDLGRRGGIFLAREISKARELAGLGANAQSGSYLREAMRQPEVETIPDSQYYGYLFVHGVDRPGLFSQLSQFIQQPVPNGAPLDGEGRPRKILRSCCRGLGREAVMVMATILRNKAEANMLTEALHRCLRDFYHRAPGAAMRHRLDQPGMPPDGYWHAEVRASKVNPSLIGLRWNEVAADVMPPFDSDLEETIELGPYPVADERGIIKNLCEAIKRMPEVIGTRTCPKLSIYFMDGRIEPAAEGSGHRFDFGLGLLVPRQHSQRIRENMEAHIQGLMRDSKVRAE